MSNSGKTFPQKRNLRGTTLQTRILQLLYLEQKEVPWTFGSYHLKEALSSTFHAEYQPKTISNNLSALSKAGYLARVRSGYYRLTPQGKAKAQEIPREGSDPISSVLAQEALFRGFLDRIVSNDPALVQQIHNLHLVFPAPGLYLAILRSKGFSSTWSKVPKSQALSFQEWWRRRRVTLLVQKNKEGTVNVSIHCSKPEMVIETTIEGFAELYDYLGTVRGMLQGYLHAIPPSPGWTVAVFDFGVDMKVKGLTASFHVGLRRAQEMIQIYTKDGGVLRFENTKIVGGQKLASLQETVGEQAEKLRRRAGEFASATTGSSVLDPGADDPVV